MLLFKAKDTIYFTIIAVYKTVPHLEAGTYDSKACSSHRKYVIQYKQAIFWQNLLRKEECCEENNNYVNSKLICDSR
jgi:hypothetical protein